MKRLLSGLRRPPLLASRDAYALWADSYPAAAHNRLMAIEEAAMRDLMPPLHGATLLDLACGSGRYSRIARDAGAAQIIGIDNSAAMLRHNTTAPIILADMDTLPLATNRFDGILCGLAIGHFPQLERALSAIGRVLRPGGWALISDIHPFVALNGGQRTFTAAGQTYAVEHHIHLYADYLHAAQRANLVIEAAAEPVLEAGEQRPVVLVLRLRKRSAPLHPQEVDADNRGNERRGYTERE